MIDLRDKNTDKKIIQLLLLRLIKNESEININTFFGKDSDMIKIGFKSMDGTISLGLHFNCDNPEIENAPLQIRDYFDNGEDQLPKVIAKIIPTEEDTEKTIARQIFNVLREKLGITIKL